MKFNILEIFNRSVTIELETDSIYQQDEKYTIEIDGKVVYAGKQNVVSIPDLLPDKDYSISVKMGDTVETRNFTTGHESYLLDVTAFGAKGDGVTMDTAAIQAAICACPKDGTVYLPKGEYLVTPLFLKSDMTLWLDKGAVILGDTDRNHYPVLPGMTRATDEKSEYNLGTWEGNPLNCYASLITAIDAQNLDIIGPGTIDGNAGNSDWWVNAKVKRGAWRPFAMYLVRCQKVRVQNVRVQNSPCWTVHPYYSDDLAFLNLYMSRILLQ